MSENIRKCEPVIMANVMLLKNPFLLAEFESADCILSDDFACMKAGFEALSGAVRDTVKTNEED